MAFWLLADLLILLASAAEGVAGRPAASCQTRCGDVDIPYPFGIGLNCSRGQGFEIACNTRNGNGDMVPTLAAANGSIHVQSLSVKQLPEVKVMLPVAYNCYNSSNDVTKKFYGEVDLNNKGVYRISDSRNMFVVIGCNTLSYTKNGNSGGSNSHYSGLFYTGCVSYCNDSRSAQDVQCAGVGCCHVDISPGLTDNVVSFGPWPRGFQEKKSAGYACVSDNSECVNSTNGPGYYCKCKQGYEGNPYDKDQGCKDINECDVSNKKKYPCYGVCNNIPGDYECHCRVGYQWSGEGPKKQECSSKFPLAARLALVLQKVDNVKIFTKDELMKITKNNSEVLGQGSFGKVYKGTLEDNTTVAVKTSIEVNENRKDDFTNEVIIQSQMKHNNIIKLLGCCLEVDVPMLVYEFAGKGNLQDILHGDANIPLPLGLCLDIAIESAKGLRYMHSSTSHTIRHGDVKPANILLTDKFIPKISDFGTSKLLTIDKDFTMFVVGSMGYIDPVFHKTGHLTQKSDVYSFGVVLLELICRKPTIYGEKCSLIIEIQNAYDQENSGRIMFDKEIANEEDILILEEIGRLAMECLKENVEERPDMKEVTERLIMLRRSRKCG
uniref:Protein kinase domain-containing protein n=1 Tax=Oryza glumipatula TaxID=40148 RepID=A0A0E0B7X6_9ORYZ